MKKYLFLLCAALVFAAEIIALIIFAAQSPVRAQDAVAVNEVLQSVKADFGAMENHKNSTALDYAVIDADGNLLFATREGISKSVAEAITHRDTVIDIEDNGVVGKLIIYNDGARVLKAHKRAAVIALSVAACVQLAICAGYAYYLNRAVIKPFGKMKGFAERVAGGNLDIPLEMDRHNLFGAFTESFDIMRAELKRARAAEVAAQQSKKELVAKLSHDIKTPVASIKAVSEIGLELSADAKTRESYAQIIDKTDRINTLVTNLFTATLEELQQLTVSPTDIQGAEVKALLENSDYLHRAAIPAVPQCLVYADKLRLQQVFDNIFANSYKYAGTDIEVGAEISEGKLIVTVEDFGGGVPEEELPLIKEKFRRGGNAKEVEGAGLGLYISDYFMKEMRGKLIVENGAHGLKVTVYISLSGKIENNI